MTMMCESCSALLPPLACVGDVTASALSSSDKGTPRMQTSDDAKGVLSTHGLGAAHVAGAVRPGRSA